MKQTMHKNVRFLLFIILCIPWMLGGCHHQEKDLTNSGNIAILSGNPAVSFAKDTVHISCDRKEAAVLSFREDGLMPVTFYEVSADLQVNGRLYAAIGGGSEDINGESVTAKAEQNHSSVTRIVRTDHNGQCRFRIFAGKSDENRKGEITVRHVTLRPAEAVGSYVQYQSTDGTVRILFCKNDVQDSGMNEVKMTKWLDILADFRKEAAKLSVDGLARVDICAAELFSHYGLSGDPIYICREYMPEQLKLVAETIDKPPKDRDILWRFIHEMSHAADGFGYGAIAPRVFDSEFSAQLECAYLMTTLGYRYDGQKSASEYFSSSIPLEQRIFSDEGFLYRLLSIIETTDPQLKSIEKALLSSRYHADMTEAEKLAVFLDEISASLGFDVRTKFSAKEWQVISQKYQ